MIVHTVLCVNFTVDSTELKTNTATEKLLADPQTNSNLMLKVRLTFQVSGERTRTNGSRHKAIGSHFHIKGCSLGQPCLTNLDRRLSRRAAAAPCFFFKTLLIKDPALFSDCIFGCKLLDLKKQLIHTTWIMGSLGKTSRTPE